MSAKDRRKTKSNMKNEKFFLVNKYVSPSDVLHKRSQKHILGGFNEGGGYTCYCGGEYVGESETQNGCAYLCCVHLYGADKC